MSHMHHVPGRLRVRVPVLKGNETVARLLRERLSAIEGVTKAESNLLTGSVIVSYDPARTTHVTVLSALQALGFAQNTFDSPTPVRDSRKLSATTARIVRKAAVSVATHVVETAVERSLTLLVLSLL